ncbi:unnamed protein product, partial [Rotaria sp. Silwood2]
VVDFELVKLDFSKWILIDFNSTAD